MLASGRPKRRMHAETAALRCQNCDGRFLRGAWTRREFKSSQATHSYLNAWRRRSAFTSILNLIHGATLKKAAEDGVCELAEPTSKKT